MTTELTPLAQETGVQAMGQIANGHAAKGLFADYRGRKAANTVRRHDAALALFAEFLAAPGVPGMPSGGELAQEPAAWRGITWGLVAKFQEWLLARGYAISSVNGSLSIVKTYAKRAAQAGAIPPGEWALIRAVEGYRGGDAVHIDETRARTRTGPKKAEPVVLTKEQVDQLRKQPDTPQGRRDAVLIELLLDMGLRVGELAGVTVDGVNLTDNTLTFYRPKVHKTQTHELKNGVLRAVRTYMEQDAPAVGPLLRASVKGGALTTAGMTDRTITHRVRELGMRVGVSGLSAHDLRHSWATRAARNGTPIDRLQDAGGWASPAMPLRYVESAKIANEGVILE